MSILIIDDFQEARDLLYTILHSAGFGPLVPVATARVESSPQVRSRWQRLGKGFGSWEWENEASRRAASTLS